MSRFLNVFTHPPRRVRLDAVDGELDRLWQHPDDGGEARTPLTRACRSNLIVLCSSRAEGEQMERDLATLVQYHPCRVLLFVQDHTDGTDRVETEVSTHIGEDRQVIAEQVTIRAGAAPDRRLTSVAPTLLIGGLPSALWWVPQAAPPSSGELFDSLSDMAHQLIYDSFGWTDAAGGVAAMAGWIVSAPSDKTLVDLAWNRLDPWRLILSEALDAALAGKAPADLQSLTIQHGVGASVPAWLFIAWFAGCFGLRPGTSTFNAAAEMDWVSETTGTPLRVTLRPANQPGYEVAGVEVGWRDGGLNKTAHFRRTSPERQMVVYESSNAYSQAIMLPSVPRAVAVARQLAVPTRDTSFIDALTLARAIVQTLLT